VQLDPHFTVYAYDRRGRGDSGDTPPFAVEREVEDIEALITEAGGSACVYGISSGACLVFEAARILSGRIAKLALYEPPYNSDPESVRRFMEYRTRLGEVLALGRKGDAVELFMRLVGASDEGVAQTRQSPAWPAFEAVAPTLPYDAAAMGDSSVPYERAASITVPTLVLDGGASLPFMHPTAVALAGALPNGQQRTLAAQTHDVAPEVLAPVLVEFFKGE
jgi:pimeloyl-ACP methyl ester carboxylesterase